MEAQLNLIRDRVVSFRLQSLRRAIFASVLLTFLLLVMLMAYIFIDNYYEIKDYQNQLTMVLKKSAT